MNWIKKIFKSADIQRYESPTFRQHGGMMMEFLLSLALGAAMIPFILRQERARVERAGNIALEHQLASVRGALELYMDANKKDLLAPVGKHITRVRLKDLVEFGLPDTILNQRDNQFQMRIIKSADNRGAILRGIVVISGSNITPIRTREIAQIGGSAAGFLDGTRAYGAFGSWREDSSSLGLAGEGAVIATAPQIGSADYLWRLPSDFASDATMASNMNLGGQDIVSATFADARRISLDEFMTAKEIAAGRMTFQNRVNLDKDFEASEVTVSGVWSSDSRSLEIANTLTLAGAAKLSNFTADEMWVNTLTLSGFSVGTESGPAILKASGVADMTAGRVMAMFASVGFSGSVTPKLNVTRYIEDPQRPEFFWDLSARSANVYDAQLSDLNTLAASAFRKESASNTESTKIFGVVSSNKNATAADFLNALNEISARVSFKYNSLNLE